MTGCWEVVLGGGCCWCWGGILTGVSSRVPEDGLDTSSSSTTITSAPEVSVADATGSPSTLAAPLGMAEGVEVGPGVSGPEVDPLPASGSTFSLPFSWVAGFSPSLVMMAMMRSRFLRLLTSSANRLVELMLFSRPPGATTPVGTGRRGEEGGWRDRDGGDRLWLRSPRLRVGLRLPLLCLRLQQAKVSTPVTQNVLYGYKTSTQHI